MNSTNIRTKCACHRGFGCWVFALFLFALPSCAPSPKHQACSIDSECKDDYGASAYCMHSRCVECVSSSTCKGGERCVNGSCE